MVTVVACLVALFFVSETPRAKTIQNGDNAIGNLAVYGSKTFKYDKFVWLAEYLGSALIQIKGCSGGLYGIVFPFSRDRENKKDISAL